MYKFSKALGDAVKKARISHGLTQAKVAEMVDIDVRTVMHIENYKANPKMEVLYPLLRALRIDPREIFRPEQEGENPDLCQLRYLLEGCSEKEAAALVPIVESVLAALRSDNYQNIK